MKRTLHSLCLLLAGVLLLTGSARAAAPQSDVRNLIFLIGDGMGLAHVSMLEIAGNYAPTAFDRTQHVALMTTHSANNRVTDSAAAATALATGTKTNNAALGVDPEGTYLTSMLTKAQYKGMATGIAVTCYLQHATPAGFYAHTSSRGDTPTITRHLLAADIDVLLGGGRRWLKEPFDGDSTYLDAFRSRGYRLVDDLSDADTIHSGRLLGVFAEEHLPAPEKRGDYLPSATAKALEILSSDAQKGFMLIVEGSQIDLACHANDAARTLAETRDFEHAVAVAMDFADRTPGTLVVIAADHETGGLTIPGNDEDFTHAESGLKYDFSTGGHTGVRVPVYFYGTGADRFGALIDNTELARTIMTQLGLE